MIIADQLLDDSDLYHQLYRDAAETTTQFLQLSPGVVTFQIRTVELGGLTLLWLRSHGRVRWRDVKEGGAWHFGVVVESGGGVSARGRDLGSEDANVFIPGRDSEFMMRGPYLTLEIVLDQALVDELGWSFYSEQLRRVSRPRLRNLIRVCRQISNPDPVGPHPMGKQLWRHESDEIERARVLEALEPVLQPWLAGDDGHSSLSGRSGTRSFELLNRSDAFFEALEDGDLVEVDLLAASLGVARRTVFRAFREALGIGPYQYLELKRLHTLKARLRRADERSTSVTEIAAQLGFTELGRLAGKYKRQFGEYPSETLRRT